MTQRTSLPAQPPEDWAKRLQDYHQVCNILNGYSCAIGDDNPAAQMLFLFLSNPIVAEQWNTFSQTQSKL